ncbi:cytochrome P450 [Leptodontidium sp. 2 PMI_412]|nr:cytochrome P450 [Leptodontidium sp. 2 PMI_412]
MALLIPLCAAVFGLLLLYLGKSIIYNLYFHPFRKYPGPALARVSRIWSRRANLNGLKYMRIHQAHQKHGPIVRIGPNELSFANPAAVKDIYTSDSFVKEESFYFAKRGYEEEHLFSFRNPDAHTQRRKLLSRGYSQGTVLSFEQEISTKLQTMFDQISTEITHSKPVDIYQWAQLFSFDVVYHLLFGEDPRSLGMEKEHATLGYFRAWKPIFAYKEFLPQMEKFGIYLPGSVGDNFRKVKAWKDYSVSLIKKSRQNDVVTPFFRSILYGEKDGYLGRPLTDSEIAEECMSGMFGGTGTTANTFVFLLWATLQNPAVVKQLKHELKSALPDIKSIPDYQAVISETLRVYPTIVAMLPRTAVKDTIVAGIKIPKGTVVGTQNYTIHRWESAFPNAEDFVPDRWLQNGNIEERKAAFVPFSIGTRRCIGMK